MSTSNCSNYMTTLANQQEQFFIGHGVQSNAAANGDH
jgi:hypothetical protein